MVLSYHPCFVADENRLCAGRRPDDGDRAAMQRAAAVVLPQGCGNSLYRMARQNCTQVFPDYRARFRYPGKTGQARLFAETGAPHPATQAFAGVNRFDWDRLPADFPLVFKFDWGGGGETVFPARDPGALEKLLKRARRLEAGGQRGFVLQALVPGGHRCLRVAVIGRRFTSYWRTLPPGGGFAANVARGASIEPADDRRTRAAETTVKAFCRRTGINLAGFDLLFTGNGPRATPLLLEINYFFGRRGLGGGERFYRWLEAEIGAWLARRGLAVSRPGAPVAGLE